MVQNDVFNQQGSTGLHNGRPCLLLIERRVPQIRQAASTPTGGFIFLMLLFSLPSQLSLKRQ
jgi:hypothetical protein